MSYSLVSSTWRVSRLLLLIAAQNFEPLLDLPQDQPALGRHVWRVRCDYQANDLVTLIQFKH